MPKLTRPTRVRPRAGFTLTELMVSLVMFGIVSAIILGLVRSQQRFYRGATEIIDVRSQLRQAAAILPLDLRSISTVSQDKPVGSPYQPSVLGSDITEMKDKEVTFRATIGSGVICQAPAANAIAIAPVGVLARGNILTSWYAAPQDGDVAFVFDRGTNDGATDDQWWPYTITVLPDSKLPCPVSPPSPLLSAGDANSVKPQFLLAPMPGSPAALPGTVGTGAVVRFTRLVAYGLYPVDPLKGPWFLGFKTTEGTSLGSWQPVSGPYRPYSPGGTTNGIQFVYYDSSNVVTTKKDAVARIDVTMRSVGSEVRNAASYTSQATSSTFKDSLLLRIAVRNRS